MQFKVIEYRQLVQILVMFMVVQFFGLLLAIMSFSGQSFQQIESMAVFNSYTSALFYIGYVVLISAVIVVVFKTFNVSKMFRIFEAVLVFVTSFIVFSTLLGFLPYGLVNSVFGLPVGLGFIFGIVGAIILVYAKNRWPYLRNTAAMISAVGVGFLLGITFSFLIALVFMAFLAVYDFIAVFITKHMLSLARVAQENNLALLIGVNDIEGIPRESLGSKALSEYRKAARGKRSKLFSSLARKGLVPFAARIELGTGDLAIPLMVAVSAYTAHLNFVLPFFIIFGAIFGLFITMLILKRYKRALPAIPPLLMGIAVSIGLYIVVSAL